MRGGSKPGERRGGRQKGTQNKATERREELFAASGLLPMDFLLSVMRDPGQPMRDRIDAAAKVANYVHPRLTGSARQWSCCRLRLSSRLTGG
jgi:hypothetical protein